jgi:hypothetical protein
MPIVGNSVDSTTFILHPSGGFALFPSGTLTSSIFTTSSDYSYDQIQRSASFIFESPDQLFTTQFRIPSGAINQTQDVIPLFITSSGINPRIGIGTNNPIKVFDFKEVRDDARGGELLVRGSRTDKGAVDNDEVGRINFIIDSSSYEDITTSGSAAEIVAIVDSVNELGVQGSLSLRVANTKQDEPIQRIRLRGYTTESAIEITGSTEFNSNVIIKNNFTVSGSILSDVSTSGDFYGNNLYLTDDLWMASGSNLNFAYISGTLNEWSMGIAQDGAFKGDLIIQEGGGWTLRFREDEGLILYEEGGVGNYKDFRIEGNSDTHLFFVSGGEAKVGIGTSIPTEKLSVVGNISASGNVYGVTGSFDLIQGGTF